MLWHRVCGLSVTVFVVVSAAQSGNGASESEVTHESENPQNDDSEMLLLQVAMQTSINIGDLSDPAAKSSPAPAPLATEPLAPSPPPQVSQLADASGLTAPRNLVPLAPWPQLVDFDYYPLTKLPSLGMTQASELPNATSLSGQPMEPLNQPAGVLCRTLLHPAVNEDFRAFTSSALGAEMATNFANELNSKCAQSFTSSAWARLSDGYTGTWQTESTNGEAVIPMDNLIFGAMGTWLNNERARTAKAAQSWDHFRNGGDSAPPPYLIKVISAISNGPVNGILDFGCGSGVELARVGAAFGLSSDKVFCIEIVDYVSPEVRNNMTILMADVNDYEATLSSHLPAVQGKLTAVWSEVVFHHITKPEHRAAALNFIKSSLEPQGHFIMAEWDNNRKPIDWTIYFDLSHNLPQLYFSDPAPTMGSIAKLDTIYESLDGWISLLDSYGLKYDIERSKMPFKDSNGTVHHLASQEQADHSRGRNFLAMFGL